jgi:UDPglucose 6-dehydrogenase
MTRIVRVIALQYSCVIKGGQLRFGKLLHRCGEDADGVVPALFCRSDSFPIPVLSVTPVQFKGRNICHCAELSARRFLYHGIGWPVAGHCKVIAA